MYKITGFEKEGRANKIWLDDGVRDEQGNQLNGRMHMIMSGQLEAFSGAYGIGVGEALMLILADGSVEGLDCPEPSDPAARSKIRQVVKAAEEEFVWEIDRDVVLAQITLAEDTAEMVRSQWAAEVATAVAEEPMDYEDILRERARMAQGISAGHQKRQEELVADEFVSADPELSKVPRDTTSINVGLGIKYV